MFGTKNQLDIDSDSFLYKSIPTQMILEKMIKFLKSLLLIINVITFAIMMLFIIFGIYDQIAGPGNAERLLKQMNIPLSYTQVFVIGFIWVVFTLILYKFRKEMFKE